MNEDQIEFALVSKADKVARLEQELNKLKQPWVTHDKISRALHAGDIWWHDNGEQIFPVILLWSPTSESFFATQGQWGWTRSQDVSEMRGMWMPCVEPEPDKHYRENWIGE